MRDQQRLIKSRLTTLAMLHKGILHNEISLFHGFASL